MLRMPPLVLSILVTACVATPPQLAQENEIAVPHSDAEPEEISKCGTLQAVSILADTLDGFDIRIGIYRFSDSIEALWTGPAPKPGKLYFATLFDHGYGLYEIKSLVEVTRCDKDNSSPPPLRSAPSFPYQPVRIARTGFF